MLIDVLFLFIYDERVDLWRACRSMTVGLPFRSTWEPWHYVSLSKGGINWSCRGLDCASKVSVLVGFHLVLGLLTCQVDANTPGSGHVKLWNNHWRIHSIDTSITRNKSDLLLRCCFDDRWWKLHSGCYWYLPAIQKKFDQDSWRLWKFAQEGHLALASKWGPQVFLLLSVLWRRLAENHAVLVESSVSPWRLAMLGYRTSFKICFAVLFVVCLLDVSS